MNLNFTANILGVFSLLAFTVAISPTLMNFLKLLPKPTRIIFNTAHYALLVTVCLGLIHGLLMTQQDNINFYELNTYWVYAAGLFTFNILAFLAFMYTEFKADLKKLNYLSYGALLLLAFHVGQQIIF